MSNQFEVKHGKFVLQGWHTLLTMTAHLTLDGDAIASVRDDNFVGRLSILFPNKLGTAYFNRYEKQRLWPSGLSHDNLIKFLVAEYEERLELQRQAEQHILAQTLADNKTHGYYIEQGSSKNDFKATIRIF